MLGRAERFRDRSDAGKALASKLHRFRGLQKGLILALPRGGVPVAYEVSKELELPMDVFLVRKLGVPGHEEYAMGAIASGGFSFVDQQVVQRLRLSPEAIAKVIEREEEELARREIEYGFHNLQPLHDHTVILVDDGFATGSTMKVALQALRAAGAARLLAAAPVGSPDTCQALAAFADEVACAITPEDFQAVGQFYEDFSQTSDAEVRAILDQSRAAAGRVEVRGW